MKDVRVNIFYFLFSTAPVVSISQNILPNPGFELHETCNGRETRVSDWKLPQASYYHYISDCPQYLDASLDVSETHSHSGKGYAGLCLYSGLQNGEYMLALLTGSLIKDSEYVFSGNILLSAERWENYELYQELEIAFPNKEYIVSSPCFIFYSPEIRIPVSFSNRNEEWIPVRGSFRAKGDEKYILIGKFIPPSFLNKDLKKFLNYAPYGRQKYLLKHKKLKKELLQIFTTHSKSFSIRCYFDDLRLVPVLDTLKEILNSPAKTLVPVPESKTLDPIVIQNIFFETNKSTLLPASFHSLDSLAQWLKTNPGVEIQINGYTDNTGNEKDNDLLSSESSFCKKLLVFKKSD